jgi:hypothetical protein
MPVLHRLWSLPAAWPKTKPARREQYKSRPPVLFFIFFIKRQPGVSFPQCRKPPPNRSAMAMQSPLKQRSGPKMHKNEP